MEQDIKELTKCIENIANQSGRYSLDQAFDKFVEVTHEALQRAMYGDLRWNPDLQEYEKARQELQKGIAVLLKNVYPEYTYYDIIGGVYMNLETIANKHTGQFFTPWHVAEMIGKVTLADVPLEKYTSEDPMTICDPACGSGVMLLGAASALPREFIDQGRVRFYGCDIDQTCVNMARLNILLYGLNMPGGFIKPTTELTPTEIERFPEPYKQQIQQTLFDLEEVKA